MGAALLRGAVFIRRLLTLALTVVPTFGLSRSRVLLLLRSRARDWRRREVGGGVVLLRQGLLVAMCGVGSGWRLLW